MQGRLSKATVPEGTEGVNKDTQMSLHPVMENLAILGKIGVLGGGNSERCDF